MKDIETSVFKRHPSSKVLIAATDEDRSALMVHEIAHVWCDAKEHPQGKIGIVEDIMICCQHNNLLSLLIPGRTCRVSRKCSRRRIFLWRT